MKETNKNLSGDPLQDLLVSDMKSMDREKLAYFLKESVVLDSEEETMHFLPVFEGKDNARKIEIILAASKARSLLFPTKVDGLFPKEIIALDVMPTGSVKSCLNQLSKNKKIKQDAEGRYFLPGYRIIELLNEKNKEQTT